MAGRGGGSKSSLYAALGVASDCSDAELRSAYRKLAMVGDGDLATPDSVTDCFPLSAGRSVSIVSPTTRLLC
jgi:hypothetical protein